MMPVALAIFLNVFSPSAHGLEWVENCNSYKEKEAQDKCLCQHEDPIITGKYQQCFKDDDCHLLADRCGGWITFNKKYITELMWVESNPKIFAPPDSMPRPFCFRNKCLKGEVPKAP